MVSCCVVCNSLMEALREEEYDLQVHSVFHQAANFFFTNRIDHITGTAKGVQPFSAVLKYPFPFEDLPKEGMRVGAEGIFGNEDILFSFKDAKREA